MRFTKAFIITNCSYKNHPFVYNFQYGIRLPETDDDLFYCQISFWGAGGKQFTYPFIITRSYTIPYDAHWISIL